VLHESDVHPVWAMPLSHCTPTASPCPLGPTQEGEVDSFAGGKCKTQIDRMTCPACQMTRFSCGYSFRGKSVSLELKEYYSMKTTVGQRPPNEPGAANCLRVPSRGDTDTSLPPSIRSGICLEDTNKCIDGLIVKGTTCKSMNS
jgi:hypothetical protein